MESSSVRTDGDAAVSSVIGTVLMLTVTMVVFAGFSTVVLKEFETSPRAPRSDLVSISRGTVAQSTMMIAHQGGESFPLTEGLIVVNEGRYSKETKLSALRPEILARLGASWDPGDTLCVRGPDPLLCMFPADAEVGGAYIVVANTLMVDVGERGKPGPAPPRPDLTVSLVSQSPPNPWIDQDITWTVLISNKGTIATPGSVSVSIQVAGNQVATASTAGPLAPGASVERTSSTWKGTLGFVSLKFIVDPANLIDESNEVNNEFVTTINVEPNFPFLDTNEDGLYQLGIDIPKTKDDLKQGASYKFINAAPHGLVIPAGVGPLTGNKIEFTAGSDGNDYLIIAVDLKATSEEIVLNGPAKIQLKNANLLAENKAVILSTTGSIQATGSTIKSNEEKISLTSTGAGISLSSGSVQTLLQAKKDIVLSAATSIQAVGSNIQSTNEKVTMSTTTGAISIQSTSTQTTIKAKKEITITAGTSIQAAGASIRSVDGNTPYDVVVLKANNGPINFSNGTLTAKDYDEDSGESKSYVMNAKNGDINAKDSNIHVKSHLRFKVSPCPPHMVFLDRAIFSGPDTSAEIDPKKTCSTNPGTGSTKDVEHDD